jgi:hypothetical protein
LLVLWVQAVHERFHDHPVGRCGRLAKFVDLRCTQDKWLLAENMLPGSESLECPFKVQGVRQGDVDGIDLRIV